ncbi:MAG: phosphoenolpyruvate--protein phosphotransferase [Vibrio sp.]
MLRQLRDIVEQVSKADGMHQAFDVLVKSTCDAMQTECCSLYLANDKAQHLELIATQGLLFQGQTIHIPFHQGLVGLVRRSAEPLNLAQASTHPEFKFFPELGEKTFNAFLGTPIIYQRQVLGVLVIQQRDPRQFSEEEEAFLVTLAAQLALVITHSQSKAQWQKNILKTQSYKGVAASSGIAVGKVWWDDSQPSFEHILPASALDPEADLQWLNQAIEHTIADFRLMHKRFHHELHKDTLAIFEFYIHLLHDPMLNKSLEVKIRQGHSADWALKLVIESYIARFAAMSDPYLKERAQDLRELGQRILFFLEQNTLREQAFQQPIILLVRELTASILASIPRENLLAVISLEGAANSHAAILARALGIPTVMGVALAPKEIVDKPVIVDGYSGQVLVEPSEQLLQEYQALIREEQQLSQLVEQDISKPALTQDQQKINVMLNAGLSADTQIAHNQGVDGVGLYRTEIGFLLQQRFPTESEQVDVYRHVLESYPDRPVIMRTLDIGGDKALPYFPIEEDNPFLGWRGIRFTLDHPDIFLIQLRAMLVASRGLNNLEIMLPMISGCKEVDDAFEIIEQAYQDVIKEAPDIARPKIGVMLEVPSMVYLLPFVADKIDFISIGSNDLTQYLLAVDRNNPNVSSVYESVHPGVIWALKQIFDTSQKFELPVCICGELAGDPLGALILVGLGYRTLSMNSSNVAKIKYILRHSDTQELTQLASQALTLPYGEQIHQMLSQYLESKGLAGFIRAGK